MLALFRRQRRLTPLRGSLAAVDGAGRPPGAAGLALSIPYGLAERNAQFIVCYMITRTVLLIKYSLGTAPRHLARKASAGGPSPSAGRRSGLDGVDARTDGSVTVYHFLPKARPYVRAHIVVQVVALVLWGVSFSVVMPYRLAFWYPSLALDAAVSFWLSKYTQVGARVPTRPCGVRRS